jgi:hypothetical protein
MESSSLALLAMTAMPYCTELPAAVCAIFRRQSRHRQSPPSTGIGNRAVSSAHQHGPAGRQANSVPQAEQARRRDTGLSDRFVMKRTKPWPVF